MENPNLITPMVQCSTVKGENQASLSKLSVTNYNSSISVHDIIRPVYKLLNRIHLWPYEYSDGDRILPLSKSKKLCSYAFLVVYMLGLSFKTYFRVPQYVSGSDIAAWVIEAIFNAFIHALVLLSILLTNSEYYGELLTGKFYLKAEQIRKRYWIAERSFFKDLQGKISWQLKAVLSAHFFVLLINVGAYFYAVGPDFLIVSTSLYVSLYFYVFIAIQVDNKLEILLAYYRKLNGQFSKALRFKCSTELSCVTRVDEVIEIYSKLCDMVAIFNEVHGWQILMIIVSMVAMILGMLYGAVSVKGNYLVGSNVIVAFGLTTGTDIVVLIFYLVLVMKLIMNCSTTTKEASKIGMLANEALVKMRRLNSPYKPNPEELKTLIDQVAYRNPRFSAAGVCNVDMTIIPAMLGAVTSYFIVLLQFRDTSARNCAKNSTLEH